MSTVTNEQFQSPLTRELYRGKRRAFDQRLAKTLVRVGLGQTYATEQHSEAMLTFVGRSVAVCVRDVRTRYGVVSTLVLPDQAGGLGQIAALRYGTHVLETLVHGFLAREVHFRDLEIKLFGGADPVSAGEDGQGARTAKFVETYFQMMDLKPNTVQLRGNGGRRLVYFPENGRVTAKELVGRNAEAIFAYEADNRVRVLEDSEGRLSVYD